METCQVLQWISPEAEFHERQEEFILYVPYQKVGQV